MKDREGSAPTHPADSPFADSYLHAEPRRTLQSGSFVFLAFSPLFFTSYCTILTKAFPGPSLSPFCSLVLLQKDRETSFDGADALIFPKSKTGEDTIYAKSISLQVRNVTSSPDLTCSFTLPLLNQLASTNLRHSFHPHMMQYDNFSAPSYVLTTPCLFALCN